MCACICVLCKFFKYAARNRCDLLSAESFVAHQAYIHLCENTCTPRVEALWQPEEIVKMMRLHEKWQIL